MSSEPRVPEEVRCIVLHCTQSGPSTDITPLQINQRARGRGFIDAPYHVIIERNGKITYNKLLSEVAAHYKLAGRDSMGILLVGRGNNFTQAQKDSLLSYVGFAMVKFPNLSRVVPIENIVPTAPPVELPTDTTARLEGLLNEPR